MSAPVRAVTHSPEIEAACSSYVSRLAGAMNASLCFLAAATAASPEKAVITRDAFMAVDDALADAYWNRFGGLLTPPCILDLMTRSSVGASGPKVIARWSDAWNSMYGASLTDAIAAHGQARAAVVVDAMDGRLTDFQLSASEFLLDHLLLQRGTVEDLRRVESERQPGQARAEVLQRWDQEGDIQYEAILRVVVRPDHVLEWLPPERYTEMVEFAATRRPFYEEGLLPAN